MRSQHAVELHYAITKCANVSSCDSSVVRCVTRICGEFDRGDRDRLIEGTETRSRETLKNRKRVNTESIKS